MLRHHDSCESSRDISQSESLFPLTVRRDELSLMTCKEAGDRYVTGRKIDNRKETGNCVVCVTHTTIGVVTLFPWPVVRERELSNNILLLRLSLTCLLPFLSSISYLG